jgi:glutathione S-transferase
MTPEPEYRLYGFAQSGHCYKVALCLELAGADWKPRFVDGLNGETRTSLYRETVNEMGEVPVLEHRGLRLTQSAVILDYLSEQFGKWGPRDSNQRREILRWLFWDNHKLSSYTGTYRFCRMFAPSTPAAVTEEFGRRAASNWKILDTHLAGRRFVVGDEPSIADLSLCGYLFFEDELGVEWQRDHANLKAWLERIRALPGWRHPYELLPGHPLVKRDPA